MSWVIESGLHEGYWTHVTRGVEVSSSSSSAGMIVRRPREDEAVPWSELLGWQLRCDCYQPGTFKYSTWEGPLWLARQGEHDPEEAVREWDGELHTLEEIGLELWRQHHLIHQMAHA